MSKTVELTNSNRIAGDTSIVAFADGAFFDHNGSILYSDINDLLSQRPDLGIPANNPYKPSGNANAPMHDSKAVTEAATVWKSNYKSDLFENYLPFADINRIMSNIGITKYNQLGVMMWRPTSGGSNRGNHYSFAQYRGDNGWMSVKGTDAKTVESMTDGAGDIYCTFGAGDFLLLKSTGLNYLCFGGDGAAKNSPHIEFIKKKVAGRTVRLIADNDASGAKTKGYLEDMGLKVEVFDWRQLGALAKPKMDLRDISWMIYNNGGDLPDLTRFISKEADYVK